MEKFKDDAPGAAGSAYPVSGTTGANGLIAFLGSRAPAYWYFFWNSPVPISYCQGVSVEGFVDKANGSYTFGCEDPNGYAPNPFALQITPGVINLYKRPSSLTVSGAPVGAFANSSFGLPQTQYIDSDGTIGGIANSSSVSSDGTSITGPVPSGIDSLATGTYAGLAGDRESGYTINIKGGGRIGVVRILTCPPAGCGPP